LPVANQEKAGGGRGQEPQQGGQDMGHDWQWANEQPDAAERVTRKLAAHNYRPTVLARRLTFEAKHPDIHIWNEDGQWQIPIPGEDILTYAHGSRMMGDLEKRYPE
jgi:hypothetical protein